MHDEIKIDEKIINDYQKQIIKKSKSGHSAGRKIINKKVIMRSQEFTDEESDF